MTDLIIKAVGLKKAFELGGFMSNSQKVIALDGVDVSVESGQVVAIIGESGSGKTTLGKALCRLLRLDDGSVEFLGQDLLKVSGKALLNVRKGFQMVFQNQSANLHPRMTVEEMLSESLKLHRPELSDSQRQTHINELAEQVGLSERLMQRPTSLSGGEKRRAGLARILATKPKLIVADEPTSGLDAAIKLQIIDLLQSLRTEEMSYIIISHDLGLVRRIADRVIVMLHGRVIEECMSKDLSGRVEHHPYTIKLMRAAVLDRDRRRPPRERRHPPRIVRPSLEEARNGCVYATTCALAERAKIFDQCISERPMLYQISEGHHIACHAIEQGVSLLSDDDEEYPNAE